MAGGRHTGAEGLPGRSIVAPYLEIPGPRHGTSLALAMGRVVHSASKEYVAWGVSARAVCSAVAPGDAAAVETGGTEKDR